MEFIDIGILAVLLIPALVGVIYGFLNITLSIIAWLIALGIAVKFSSYFAPMLDSYIETDILRDGVAFIGLFTLSLMIFTALGYFMLKLLGRSGLTAADRFLGLFLGLGLGGSIIAVLVFLAGFTEITGAPWWRQSLLVRPFERTGVWVRQFIPDTVAKHHRYSVEEPVVNQGG